MLIDRWIEKISKLESKREQYENLFKKELGKLNDDFDVLKLQSQELQLRLRKADMKERINWG